MNEDERLAEIVVEEVLDGARMEYREEREQSEEGSPTHDFWLHRPGRDRAALEVTSDRETEWMRTADKLGDRGPLLDAEHCGRRWRVYLRAEVRVGEAVKGLDRALAELERLGVNGIPQMTAWEHHEVVERIRSDLGIDRAVSVPVTDGTPQIEVYPELPSGYLHAGIVKGAVEEQGPENAEKLEESGADERHLFVRMTDPLAAFALVESEPGESPLELPPGITHVWAASKFVGEKPEYAVWRGRRGEPWRTVDRDVVPDEVTGRAEGGGDAEGV